MTKSVTINNIDFSVIDTGNGQGFVSAQSTDRDNLELCAGLLKSRVSALKEATITFVTPEQMTRKNGQVVQLGGYYRFEATF